MESRAIVMAGPGALALRMLALTPRAPDQITVETAFSGVSTGTERLFWTGRMPAFPGMGYPLVPGYEAVGTVVDGDAAHGHLIGRTVFVPGADCFEGARGLFGGQSARLHVPAHRAVVVADDLGADATLLALAATAYHALDGGRAPGLIVGHGVLGRLLARLTVALGHQAPAVWETNPARRGGAMGYPVLAPEDDARRDYGAIYDASGAADLADTLIARLARGGELVLAGFYEGDVRFAFAPAFMREARLRIAAEFVADDLTAVVALIDTGALSLAGLVTHRASAAAAAAAYPQAFDDPACLKMIFDWKGVQ